jgi:hypothetical protein
MARNKVYKYFLSPFVLANVAFSIASATLGSSIVAVNHWVQCQPERQHTHLPVALS